VKVEGTEQNRVGRAVPCAPLLPKGGPGAPRTGKDLACNGSVKERRKAYLRAHGASEPVDSDEFELAARSREELTVEDWSGPAA
jgi:hypothetical protein